MRKGFNGLSMLAQDALKQDLFSGHLFVFQGRRDDLVKIIWWDGQGAYAITAASAKLGVYAAASINFGSVALSITPSTTGCAFTSDIDNRAALNKSDRAAPRSSDDKAG